MKEYLRNRKKRFWAMLLAIVMIVGVMPYGGVRATDRVLDQTGTTPNLGIPEYLDAGDHIKHDDFTGDKLIISYTDVNGISGANSIIQNKVGTGATWGLDMIVRSYGSSTEQTPKSFAAGYTPMLTNGQISDCWKVTSASKDGGEYKVSLQALPKYTVTWMNGNLDITNDVFVGDFLWNAISYGNANKQIIDYETFNADGFKEQYAPDASCTFAGWLVGTNNDLKTIDDLKSNDLTFYKTLDEADGSGDYNITFTAAWKTTVTYNANLSGIVNVANLPAVDTTAIIGKTINAPATGDPTATGYTFAGWYKEPACTTAWDFDTNTVDGSTTLYAKWTNNVTFDLNGHGTTAPAVQVLATGAKVTKPDVDPVTEGYTFGGWCKDVACTTAWDFDTDTVVGPTTLYAKWTQNKYNVTFDANAPEAVTVTNLPAALANVAYGSKIDAPASNPIAEGYTFGGWYKEAACTNAWDFANDTVTAATTLYAKWTQNVYTVTFVANAPGTATVTNLPANENVTHGLKVNAPATDPTAEGYTFGGWYKEAACTTKWDFATDTVTADTTIYAKWRKNYTIRWKDANGKVIKTETLPEGTVPSFSGETPTKETADKIWALNGWKINDTEYVTGTGLTAITGDTDITASFISTGDRSYNVTFVDEDGVTVLKEAKAYAYGTKADKIDKPTDPTKASDGTYNYTFNGWTPEIVDVTPDTVDKVYIYKAVYSRSEINNNPGGGSGNGGGTTPPPSPTPDLDPTPTPDPDPTPTPDPDPTPTPNPDPTPDPDPTPSANPSGSPSQETDEDDVDDSFSSLFLRMTKRTKKSITFKWSTKGDADEYDIYWAKCAKKDDESFSTYEFLTTVKGSVGKYTAKLKKKGYYKFYVVAIKIVDGERIPVKRSVDIHGTTLRKKYTSASKVNIMLTGLYIPKKGSKTATQYPLATEPIKIKYDSKGNVVYTEYTEIPEDEPIDVTRNVITLHVGQKVYLKGIESNPEEAGKIISVHRGIRYESADKDKVKVSYKEGTVTAKEITEKPVKVYAYAQNGVYTKVYIKVVE
ncbi:MAG: InlB B-repeat-containing protein [Lachnospiraceae bacterium]|nr:InlB B-repeat-containing protein [Lachnospiraceae bacterium]